MPAAPYVLVIGTILITLTVLIHVLGLISITWVANWFRDRFTLSGRAHRVALTNGIVLGLFGVVSVEIWLWTAGFLVFGVASDFNSALYLSTITYSTVGYGDILPAKGWGLLAALEGVTGFLMIGWSTAFLVTASTKFGPFRSGEHF
ncbi:MAG TPA: ion channel [Devosia sp.]|nr:ion channel [Devosia sp.]